MIGPNWKASACILMSLLLVGCKASPQARRDRYVSRGKQLMEKKDYTRALLEFRNAARMVPTDADVYYEIGMALLGSRDYRSAYASFQKALSLNPKHTNAQLRLAQIQTLTVDPDLLKDAAGRLKALMEQNGPSVEMLNSLALTELKLGAADNAIENLEEALAQAPQELSSAIMLARAKFQKNDAAGAQAVLEKAIGASPKSAAAHRILGEFLEGQKKPVDAEAEYLRALGLDASDARALLDLSRVQWQQGRRAEAEQSLKRLSAFPGYKASYGIFLYQQGRGDEAIREFERQVKEAPEDRQMRTNLVIAYRTTNRAADANRLLEAALKKNGKDSDALLQRGEMSIEKRDFAAAEVDLNRVLQLLPTAPEVHYVLARLNLLKGMPLIYRQELSEALRLNPDLLTVRLELAQNLVSANQASAALDALDHAPEYQKSSLQFIVARNWALWTAGNLPEMRKGIDRGLAIARTADLLVQDGVWKLRSGDPAGARSTLEQALKINPSDIRALQAMRQSYLMQKNAPMALQKVKELAAENPKSAGVQEFLGNLLLAAGQNTEARAAFVAAKAADPTSRTAEMSLVRVDLLDRKLDDASQRLEAILAKRKDDKTAQWWLADVETMRGQNDRAIGLFREVVASDTGNAEAYNNLSYLLLDRQPDEALKYAQKAVELVPDRSSYCDTLGWALYRKGMYSAAIPYLERAARDKSEAVWSYHLSMAYAKAGDVARSRSTFQTALQLNPNVPEAKEAKEILGQN